MGCLIARGGGSDWPRDNGKGCLIAKTLRFNLGFRSCIPYTINVILRSSDVSEQLHTILDLSSHSISQKHLKSNSNKGDYVTFTH